MFTQVYWQSEEISAARVSLSIYTTETRQHHLRFPAATELCAASASICDLINSPVGGEELMIYCSRET